MNPVQRTIRSPFGKPPRPEKAGASQAEAQRIPLTGVVLGTPAWVVVTLLTAKGCAVPGSGTGWAAAAAATRSSNGGADSRKCWHCVDKRAMLMQSTKAANVLGRRRPVHPRRRQGPPGTRC